MSKQNQADIVIDLTDPKSLGDGLKGMAAGMAKIQRAAYGIPEPTEEQLREARKFQTLESGRNAVDFGNRLFEANLDPSDMLYGVLSDEEAEHLGALIAFTQQMIEFLEKD